MGWLQLESLTLIIYTDLLEMSNILNTGLDRETLTILVGLCEAGVHPEALAAVVKELRRESAAIAAEEEKEAASAATSVPVP